MSTQSAPTRSRPGPRPAPFARKMEVACDLLVRKLPAKRVARSNHVGYATVFRWTGEVLASDAPEAEALRRVAAGRRFQPRQAG